MPGMLNEDMAATGSALAGRRRLGRRGEASFEMCQTTSTADKSQSQRWGKTAQPGFWIVVVHNMRVSMSSLIQAVERVVDRQLIV